MALFGKRSRATYEIQPEDIFLDSSNLPGRNEGQFEGRVVRPVASRAILGVGLVFAAVILVFAWRAFHLEIVQGTVYADISRNNRLDRSVVFATRGRIFDRTGLELAWNEAPLATSTLSGAAAATSTFAGRRYTTLPGLSHILGFVRYPKADARGVWWREEYAGVSGVELALNETLGGINGSRMVETDAHGIVSQDNIILPPKNGDDVVLSIDAEVQSKLYTILSAHAERQGFRGGAGVIMDMRTGELLALTSFPEYDNAAFAEGIDDVIAETSLSERTPLLNRAVAGLYTPGSIVKPIFAAAALAERIISPDTQILSTGAITIPNPYDPLRPSIFRDWTVHGLVDMRTAIAVSSDEYFYTIGGGYESQKGLGIQRLDEYARRFGLGEKTGIALWGEPSGVIPTPEWKEKVFGPDDPWRVGNTYHTAIGQFGFQITPVQAVRFTAAVGNGGKLLVPQIVASTTAHYENVGISDADLKIVREGMRLAVTSTRADATVKVLNIREMDIAAKTGTAEVGSRNQWMNSWSVGYWPSDNPRYAYAVVLEMAPAGTLSGAAPGLRPFFEWLAQNKPQYTR
ncbi:hypothetical protein C4556_00785 [Candidatus Parcubacteria bacterium]|nr:MAG: hypothetical protein C4556_00785 [Candidatus Parcubacteria bacterium]